MATAPVETVQEAKTSDLRTESQGLVTFYRSVSTPGYWFSAGEIEVLINSRMYLELPEKTDHLSLDDEFAHGPAICPICGGGTRLFEIRSYMASEVRMRACHVCHGRWIGHLGLLALMDRIRYSGLMGSLKRWLARPPAHRAA